MQKNANAHTAPPLVPHALRGNAYQSLQDVEQPVSVRNHESLMGIICREVRIVFPRGTVGTNLFSQ